MMSFQGTSFLECIVNNTIGRERDHLTNTDFNTAMVARGKLIHDAIPARKKLQKFDIFGWLKLKLLQYNISSCLYMLDPWERLLFNFFFLVMLMLSVFLFVAYLSTASTTFLSGNGYVALSLNILTITSQLLVQLLLSVSSC